MTTHRTPLRLLHRDGAVIAALRPLLDRDGVATLEEPPSEAALRSPGGPTLYLADDIDAFADAERALAGARRAPGLAEQLRRLAVEGVGRAGLFAQALGAEVDGAPVVVLFVEPALLPAIWQPLLSPFLGLSPAPAARSTPASAAPALPPAPTPASSSTGRVSLSEMPGAERPRVAEPTETPPGWRKGLEALGGALRKGAWVELPAALERVAPVQNVLDSAGEHGEVRTPDGRVWAAYGFPDLERPASKVLLVRVGEPMAEILALHRWPRLVGLVTEGEGVLPSADLDPAALCIERTGRPAPNWGSLFAVEADAVYLLRDQKVWRWDGRKETELGRPTQALASLLLQWSQR
jgi:hypothetical protein